MKTKTRTMADVAEVQDLADELGWEMVRRAIANLTGPHLLIIDHCGRLGLELHGLSLDQVRAIADLLREAQP